MNRTFKNVELPCKIFMAFDDDEEIYDAELVDIVDVDEEKDTCVLLVDELMPQRAKLKVPCHMLDSDTIDCGAGAKISLKK